MSSTTFTIPWAQFAPLKTTPSPVVLQGARSCPLSGNSEEIELFSIPEFQFFEDSAGENRVTHRVVFCPTSGMTYTNPCYTQEGFEILFQKAGQSYGHSAGRMQEVCDWVQTNCPGITSVWDIGCGTGAFLRALPNHLHRTGVDIDAPSIAKAQALTADIRFECRDFSASLPDNAPNLMTMFHVLEHLPDPLKTLQTLRKAANSDTKLLVEVPVLDNAVLHPSEDCVGFFTIQHLTHFSTVTLKAMMETAGWQIETEQIMSEYNGFRVIASPVEPQQRQLPAEQIQAQKELGQAVLSHWQNSLSALHDKVNQLPRGKKMLIWGGGQHTEYLRHFTPLFDLGNQYVVVDRDPLKHATKLHGVPILSPDSLPESFWTQNDFMVVISSYPWQNEIYEGLVKRGVLPNNIVRLYDTVRVY